MSCLRLRTCAISVLTPSANVPKRPALRTRCATLALHNSFLDGRHATAGHEPPTQRRSITATFLPERPRCQASSFPPWPLPRMTTSKCSGMVASFPDDRRLARQPRGALAFQLDSDRFHLAAVHAQRGAGHPASAGRHQERYQLGDLLRLAIASDAGFLWKVRHCLL